jgi:ankyrin repeat protein
MVGDTEMIYFLLRSGAHIDAETEAGLTPLMLASHYGRERAVKLLLAFGANIDASISDMDAYAMAKAQGHHGVLDLLKKFRERDEKQEIYQVVVLNSDLGDDRVERAIKHALFSRTRR